MTLSRELEISHHTIRQLVTPATLLLMKRTRDTLHTSKSNALARVCRDDVEKLHGQRRDLLYNPGRCITDGARSYRATASELFTEKARSHFNKVRATRCA